ncbi:hypothetical protein JXQ70_02895 [bacterium]|nr:hypothetical protein [bacterium]
MDQGHRREKIIRSKQDCDAYMDILVHASSLVHVHVFAWCLVPTHSQRGCFLSEIGELFGLHRYSSVSSVIRNVRNSLTHDQK